MSKITVPQATAEVGGALHDIIYNGTVLNTEVENTISNGIRIVDDINASSGQKLVIDETNILAILAEGGEIEDYLFGIRQPSTSATIDVPVGVPSRTFILGEVKTFARWYASNADVWLNTTTDEIIYYNSPNPSDGVILTASESELIRQIDTVNYSFMTIAEVQTEVAGPNWTKL